MSGFSRNVDQAVNVHVQADHDGAGVNQIFVDKAGEFDFCETGEMDSPDESSSKQLKALYYAIEYIDHLKHELAKYQDEL